MAPVEIGPGYDKYSKCTLDGYTKSLEFLNALEEKTINEQQIYTKFYLLLLSRTQKLVLQYEVIQTHF